MSDAHKKNHQPEVREYIRNKHDSETKQYDIICPTIPAGLFSTDHKNTARTWAEMDFLVYDNQTRQWC